MTAASLLAALEELGVKLWTDGNRLRYSAPKGALTSGLKADLARYKSEILSALADFPVGAEFAPTFPERASAMATAGNRRPVHVDPDGSSAPPGFLRLPIRQRIYNRQVPDSRLSEGT